jgi:hypothetical protein
MGLEDWHAREEEERALAAIGAPTNTVRFDTLGAYQRFIRRMTLAGASTVRADHPAWLGVGTVCYFEQEETGEDGILAWIRLADMKKTLETT